MKKISDFFYNNSTLILAVVLTVVSFAYLYLVMMNVAKCFEIEGSDVNSLGTSFGFTLDAVQAFLSTHTLEMIACYKRFNAIWDNIFALTYGLMYVAWLSYLLKGERNRFRAVNLIPFGQMLFDWLENFQLSRVARAYLEDGQISALNVKLASTFSMLKWSFSGLTFLLVIIGIVLIFMRLFKKKKA